MKALSKFAAGAAVVAGMLLASGCGSLSLFTATHEHKHYHGPDDEMRTQLDQMEHRMQRLEQQAPVYRDATDDDAQ